MSKKYDTIFQKVNYNLIKEANIEELKKEEAVKLAANLLKKGEVLAFPTETVYGLGADASKTKAVEKIYQAKGRPQDNPLIVHIANREQLRSLIRGDISVETENLISNFWPGPLTIILDKNDLLPDATTAGLSSVAIRMPAHPLSRALIELSGLALAAPSANKSGAPSPTTADHVANDLDGRIAMILDGGPSKVGLESTVLDVRGQVRILRPGGVSRKDIEKVLGYKLDDSNNYVQGKLEKELDNEKPLSPGMKYRHYSPETPLYIVKDNDDLVKILEEILHSNKGDNYQKECQEAVGFILTNESYEKYSSFLHGPGIKLIKMGSRKKVEMIAANLFSLLRSLDQMSLRKAYIEAIPEEGIGEAVMNRLYKASLES
ncbi:L-threonylcarbamoyladenylate synthase [Natronospora cellulosivora (SeqCode)]